MPGMMDTILNLGLNDVAVEGLKKKTSNGRFAKDSYRRFMQMYSDVVLGLDHGAFEEALEIAKEDRGYFTDTEMTADDWRYKYQWTHNVKPIEASPPVSVANLEHGKDVVLHAETPKDRNLLRQIADHSLELLAFLGKIDTVEPYGPPRLVQDAADDAHERRFSGAVRAEQPEHAVLYLQ